MNRRNFLSKMMGAYVTTCLPGTISLAEKQGKKRSPNVILIMTDDQGWGDIHSHGNERIDTPMMDKLAREGVRFDRFYVEPLCAPTRAAVLTGRYHLRTGTLWVTHGWETRNNKELTISEALKQRDWSYNTFMHALKEKNVELNRKMLATLSSNHPKIFDKVIEEARK